MERAGPLFSTSLHLKVCFDVLKRFVGMAHSLLEKVDLALKLLLHRTGKKGLVLFSFPQVFFQKETFYTARE